MSASFECGGYEGMVFLGAQRYSACRAARFLHEVGAWLAREASAILKMILGVGHG